MVERLWYEMRRLEVFSLPELRQVCNGLSIKLLTTYLEALEAAGYIAELSGKRKGQRYRLLQNTGILAPELRVGLEIYAPSLKRYAWVDLAVYDPNIDLFFPVVRG